MGALGSRPRRGSLASLLFWCCVALETVLRRRFEVVLERQRGGRRVEATGLGHVPREGGLVFAVNH